MEKGGSGSGNYGNASSGYGGGQTQSANGQNQGQVVSAAAQQQQYHHQQNQQTNQMTNNSNIIHKQFMKNQKAIKQAKGMIYGAATQLSGGSTSSPLPNGGSSGAQQAAAQTTQRGNNLSGTDSPHKQQQTRINAVGRSLSNERKNVVGSFNGQTSQQQNSNAGGAWTSSVQHNTAQALADHPNRKGHSVSRSNAPGMSYRSTGRGASGNSQTIGPGSVNAGASLNGHPIFLNAELKQVLATPNSSQNPHQTSSPRKTRQSNAHSLTIPLAHTSGQVGSGGSKSPSYNLRSGGSGSPTNFVIGSVGSGNTHHGLTTATGSANNKLVRYKQQGSSRNASNPHQHISNSLTQPVGGKVMDFVRKQNAGYNTIAQKDPTQLIGDQASHPHPKESKKQTSISLEKQQFSNSNHQQQRSGGGRNHHHHQNNERVSATASPLATRSQQVAPTAYSTAAAAAQQEHHHHQDQQADTNSGQLRNGGASKNNGGNQSRSKGPTVEELTKNRNNSNSNHINAGSASHSPTTTSSTRPFQLVGQQRGSAANSPAKFKFSGSGTGGPSLATSYLSGPQGNFNKRSNATAEGKSSTSNNNSHNSNNWHQASFDQQQQNSRSGSNQKATAAATPAFQYNRTMPSPPSKRATIQQHSNTATGSDSAPADLLINANNNLNKPQTSPKSGGLQPSTLPHFKTMQSKGVAPPVQNLMVKPGTSNLDRSSAAGPTGRNGYDQAHKANQNSTDTNAMMMDQIILDDNNCTTSNSQTTPGANGLPNQSLSASIQQQQLLLDRPNSSSAQPMQLSHVQLPNFESTKYSVKENGVVKAYAANTNQGIVRDYNEDRVSIVLNMQKPPQKKCDRWPKCSFFAIFDGHGGHTCADFLRDNLHQFIIRDSEFPNNPRQAIVNGFWKSEMYFLDTVEKFSAGRSNMLDRSGSCAIVTLFVDDLCFSANVGDSRAIMSCSGGRYAVALSEDHKPNEKEEHQRIISAGGKIYQTQSVTKVQDENGKPGQMREQILLGPHRVFPGRLSVSRTFGDIEAKRTKYQGNPKVVIATPDIKCFKIEDNYDYIVLGCDGIYDKLNNIQVVQAGWEAAKKKFKDRSQAIHQNCGTAVEQILKSAVAERSLDNITVVIIAFKNFRKTLKQEMDKFQDDLQKQKSEAAGGVGLHNEVVDLQNSIEDQHAAEQIDNKRIIPSETRKESGIVISKTLNLPNYDLTLQDVEVQPTLVGLARLQKLTTGSRSTSNGRGSPIHLRSGFSHIQHPFGNSQQSNQSGFSGGFFNNNSAQNSIDGSSTQDSNSTGGGGADQSQEQFSQGFSQSAPGKAHEKLSQPVVLEKQQQFIMNRRRGTAGPMNPKQNMHTDLIVQQKIGGHPNFIKTRQRSPMLPNAIGSHQAHTNNNVQQQMQQMSGRPIMPHASKNQTSGFEHAVKSSNGIVGKAPSVGRHAYGVFSSSSNTAGNGSKTGHTSNGIRNNSTGHGGSHQHQTIQGNPGMAESLRAQIATPRNNQVNQEEQQQLAQHRRYTNILSQSRARRQIGGSYVPQINTSVNGAAGAASMQSDSENVPIGGLFSPQSSVNNNNIFSNISSPQNSGTGGAGSSSLQQSNKPRKAQINVSKVTTANTTTTSKQ